MKILTTVGLGAALVFALTIIAPQNAWTQEGAEEEKAASEEEGEGEGEAAKEEEAPPAVEGEAEKAEAEAGEEEPVLGEGPEEEAEAIQVIAGEVKAIENRKYTLKAEVGLAFTTLPLNAYYKSLGATVSYTHHFGDFVAWEVVSATLTWNIDSDLRHKILSQIPSPVADPHKFEEPAGLVSLLEEDCDPQVETCIRSYTGDPGLVCFSSLVLKPLYGKFSLLNEQLMFFELSLVLGAGAGLYRTFFYPVPEQLAGYPKTTVRIVNAEGIGLRVFLTRGVSLRIDARHMLEWRGFVPQHQIFFSVGFGFNLGAGEFLAIW